MATYRIGTITGTQAGLSVIAIVQDVEWATSATEFNRQTAAGGIYASDLINPRGEVKIRAVVPRKYANIPAAGGTITVNGCQFGSGTMSLDLDGNSGETFQISSSRVVASNQATTTLEITGYIYVGATGSTTFSWELTDDQEAYDYRFVAAVGVNYYYRSTHTMTWRKAIPVSDTSPGRVNPGNLSPTGMLANEWACIDAGTSRPYFLNGAVVKECWVTWRMFTTWTLINNN